jgi:hypothetical protein
MIKYEYTVVKLDNEISGFNNIKRLNKLGNEGWKLISIYNGIAYLMKETNELILENYV